MFKVLNVRFFENRSKLREVMSETSTIKLYTVFGTVPCILFIMCASGGGARPRATEPFTKAVIHVVPAVVSFLSVVAGLQRLLSFPANSELVY